MSDLQMQETVKDIQARNITVQGVEKMVYDVIDTKDIAWTAWERDLAERAHQLKGLPAMWTVAITSKEKNGTTYENRTLKKITSVGSQAMADTLANLSAPTTSFDPSTTTLPTQANTTSGLPTSAPSRYEDSPEKRTSIHRQTAVKATAAMAGASGMTADEFWGNVVDIVRFFDTGETPSQIAWANENPDPQPGLPDSPPAHTDDDIPF